LCPSQNDDTKPRSHLARPHFPPHPRANRTHIDDRIAHHYARAMSLKSVNPNAEVMNRDAALFMNINAAKGLQDVMKTNLGPKGTIKMLVDGAGGAFACRHG